MNGAQPGIRGFVRGKCWLAGWAAKATGSLGDAPTPRTAGFATEGLRLLKFRVEAQSTASRSAVPPQEVMVDSPAQDGSRPRSGITRGRSLVVHLCVRMPGGYACVINRRKVTHDHGDARESPQEGEDAPRQLGEYA
jgi:hypothetical protein